MDVTMRWLWMFLLLALPVLGCAQQPRTFLSISDSARSYLAAEWSPSDAYQPERGFCVRFTEYDGTNVVMYRVTDVFPAFMVAASQYSSAFICPHGLNIAELHTHPPATCRRDDDNREDCRIGGDDAYECGPSSTDQDALDQGNRAFALIQCDAHAVVLIKRTIAHVLKSPP